MNTAIIAELVQLFKISMDQEDSDMERKFKDYLMQNHLSDRNLQAVLSNSSLPLHVTIFGFLCITDTIRDIEVDPSFIMPRNYPELKKVYALKLIHQSADKNEMYAQLLLANSYRYGRWHCRDNRLAFHWYQQSMRSKNAIASYHLGACYQCSIGCRKDMVKAYKCYSKFGDGFQDGLMLCYFKGKGTQKDIHSALKCCLKSCKSETIEIKYRLIQMLNEKYIMRNY
ncbi:11415_t:CDS:2 [Ambispora leptoticha]|uniref:11415_t:CDS:1 n=1 Tax=Ambispora leptoticha TaxID=144679 RepID=A0A9N9GEM0_9GLOM|nr:11415_t:CDS:2 [Ambispora leptoticha]